jgi:hypothetical protein
MFNDDDGVLWNKTRDIKIIRFVFFFTVRAGDGRWIGGIVCCFSSLCKRGRIRFCNFSDQFSVLFPQWQQF